MKKVSHFSFCELNTCLAIREMEILRNTQEAAENLNENAENRDVGSRNSSNLRSRTGSTSSGI